MTETPPFGNQGTLIGKKLGDYELLELLTSGGMARIYKGLDRGLQRNAAVKVLMGELLDSDDTLTERFEREARAIAQLEHPHIVPVYQRGVQDGYYFMAMRFIEGSDLADEVTRLRRLGQQMPPERALNILQQVADALDYAHGKSIVHRDIKPSNILLTKDDRAFLTDFGLALWALDKTMGTAFGTPRYIAPEQALASEKAVPQSDIYALAVILYEILTGDMLFHADTPMQIALSHISEPPPPPRNLNPDIPQAAEDELLRALSKEPALRHATAGEFIRAVRSAYGFVDNSPMNAPTPPLGKPIPAPPVRVTQVETPAPTPIFNPIPRPKTETQTLSQIPPDMRAAFEPKPQRSPWMFVGILAVLVALGAAGVLMLNGANEANARATLTAVAVLDQQTLTAAAVALNQTATEVTDDLNRTATTAADSVNRTATASADSINQTATASSLAIELTGTAQSLPSATPEDEPTATEEPTASPTATDEPTATRTATQTTAPSATPTATITPTVIATNTPRPTNTLSPTTPLPPSPTALVGGIAVEVSYTIDALLIRHAGEQLPADVRGLALVSAAGVELALPSTATLTSGRCILYQQQGRTFDFAGTGCVRENTTVTALGNPQQLVWRGAATDQFTIEQNGQVLATCNAVTRTQQQACSIALPVRGE